MKNNFLAVDLIRPVFNSKFAWALKRIAYNKSSGASKKPLQQRNRSEMDKFMVTSKWSVETNRRAIVWMEGVWWVDGWERLCQGNRSDGKERRVYGLHFAKKKGYVRVSIHFLPFFCSFSLSERRCRNIFFIYRLSFFSYILLVGLLVGALAKRDKVQKISRYRWDNKAVKHILFDVGLFFSLCFAWVCVCVPIKRHPSQYDRSASSTHKFPSPSTLSFLIMLPLLAIH